MKTIYGILLLSIVLFIPQKDLQAQTLLHNIEMDAGAISNPGADLYVSKLTYNPQWQFGDDKFRVGLNAGGVYRSKEVDFIVGVNAALKVGNLSLLDGNFSLGGLFVRAGFDWTGESEKILSGGLMYQLSHIAVNITYGRDLKFDNNWITTGFAISLSKPNRDPEEN